MPVLPKDVQETTKQATTGFALMEEGDYLVELLEVQTTDKAGKPLVGKESGIPYWSFVFQIPEDAERYKKRRFYVVYSHSEKAAPIRKGVLDAFGASEDVNTDDLIGKTCWVHVYGKMQDQGVNTGNLKDDIKYFIAKDKAPGAEVSGKGKSGKSASPDNF